jgi:hypothetical protein
MTLHLISAQRLGNRLSAGTVSPQEQAIYLSASFILWLLPGYFLLVPPPNPQAWSIPLGLWFYELGALVLIYVIGVQYCLGRCRVEPRKNFLIDFSCLYAPISLTTLVAAWGAFHVYASLIPGWLQWVSFPEPPRFFELLYSARFFDLMRFLATVGATFFTLIRIGNHMERISRMRLSANPALNPDAAPSPRAG